MPPPPTGSRTPVKVVDGGFQTATFYSGAVVPSLVSAPTGTFAVGSDVFLCSGPGRLDTLLQISPAQSGVPILFYDAALPVSGGPIPASGHKTIGIIPGTYNMTATTLVGAGLIGQGNITPGIPYKVSYVFNSGLCFNSRSGQPPFTCVWSPEPSDQ